MGITGFFYQNVTEPISKGTSLKVTIDQAITVLKLIEASFLSAKSSYSVCKAEGGYLF